VCEQTEDPAEAKKRGSKSVVRRDVIRLVTPGTLTEERLLDSSANNFLAAMSRLRGGSLTGDAVYGLAWIDMSTGSFQVAETDDQRLAADLAQISPRELILPDNLLQEAEIRQVAEQSGAALSPVPRAFFDSSTATDRLAHYFGVKTLDGFGTFSRSELSAAAGILAYVEKTQLGERPPLDPPTREAGAGRMLIDPATRANLELTRTLGGEKQGSLLATIDRTVTGGGSRLLASRLAGPLVNPEEISRRHDSVEVFLENEMMREALRRTLKGAPDMARALSRIALQRGGPRDILAVAQGMQAASQVIDQISMASTVPAEIAAARVSLEQAPHELGDELTRAIKEDPPLMKRDGNFVASGYDETLDELRALRDESRKVIAKLQADYAEELGLRSLKIKHNNVLGWFIEAPTAQTEKLTADPGRFIHRQTMAGAMRFTTTELADLESKIASAGERSLAIELEIFDRLSGEIVASGRRHQGGRTRPVDSGRIRGARQAGPGGSLRAPDRGRHEGL
jgi:DNA mismatch repair protein MutS